MWCYQNEQRITPHKKLLSKLRRPDFGKQCLAFAIIQDTKGNTKQTDEEKPILDGENHKDGDEGVSGIENCWKKLLKIGKMVKKKVILSYESTVITQKCVKLDYGECCVRMARCSAQVSNWVDGQLVGASKEKGGGGGGLRV